MFGLGMGEIMVILIVALLVLGPDKLPGAAKSIGKGLRELRKHTRDLQETIEQDEHLGGTVRELRSALRGEDYPPPTIKPPAGIVAKPPEEQKPPEAAPPAISPPVAEPEKK
jgi:sec-independent protein translocase protein TatB